MSISRRRAFLIGGLGLLGTGAVVWGGSLAACSLGGRDQAVLLRPLYVALADIRDPIRVGRAWLNEVGEKQLLKEVLSRRDFIEAAFLPNDAARRERLLGYMQDDFVSGNVVLSDRWVVSRTEAQIAAAWAAYET